MINYEKSDEKSALVWPGHEDVIYTGINAQNMYIKYKIYTRFIRKCGEKLLTAFFS